MKKNSHANIGYTPVGKTFNTDWDVFLIFTASAANLELES
jgi:hypothetical protein